MQGKKALVGILICANALLCALLCLVKGFGAKILASFEFAFFATLFIIALSFLSYKKSVFKKVSAQNSAQNELNLIQNANFCSQIQGQTHTQTLSANAMQAENLAQMASDDTQNLAQNANKSPQNTEFCPQIQPQIPKICLKKHSPQKIFKFKAANDEFKPSLKLAFKNFGVFFSLAKLGAYAFLALGFLTLQKQNLLSIAAFLSGISAVLLSVFAFGGLCLYKAHKP